jgi:hypothetical protein
MWGALSDERSGLSFTMYNVQYISILHVILRYSLTHTQPLSLSFTHTHIHTLSHSFTHSLTHTVTVTHNHSLSLSLSFTVTHHWQTFPDGPRYVASRRTA